MKILRRTMSLVLTVCLLMSLLQMPSSAKTGDIKTQSISSYTDTAGHWAEEEIEKWSEMKIFGGAGGKFRPNNPITRGEMAVVFTKVLKLNKKAENNFTDLDKKFYTEAVLKVNAAGIMQGYDSRIRPKDNITRQEAAVMIVNALGIEQTTYKEQFTDMEKIASWAIGSVAALSDKGIMNGYKGLFRPTDNITRAEIVQVLDNTISKIYTDAKEYNENVEGTLIVTGAGTVLKDMTITGDLIIADGVGQGEVTLDNVIVKGTTVVRAGGADSIIVNGNSKLGRVIIMKHEDGTVSVKIKGNAKIDYVIAKNGDISIKGSVGRIDLMGHVVVTISDATIETINIEDTATLIIDNNATVTTVSVAQAAEAAKIEVAGTVSIINTSAVGTTVSGSGTVSSVMANADKVEVSTAGTSVTAASGTTGVIAGSKNVKAGSTEYVPVGPTSSSGTTTPPMNSEDNTSITLDKTSLQILAGTEYQLKAALNPSGATSSTIKWTSSKPEVATVDSNGKITAAALETLKNKTKSQRTTTITATVGGKSAACTITVGPIEVYFYQSLSYNYENDPLKLFQAPGGVQILWEDTGAKTASFHQPQYIDGLSKVVLDIETSKANNTEVTISYKNRFYTAGSSENIFQYKLTADQLKADGKQTITINMDDFIGTFNDPNNRQTNSPLYTGENKKAYQISQFDIALSGNDPELDTKITNFMVYTDTDYSVKIFDASEFSDLFQDDSPAYIEPTPYAYEGVRKPRVLIADNANGVWDRLDQYIALSKEWPEGSFGVDMSVMLYGSNRELVDKMQEAGIKTMYEINKTFPYYSHYVESNDDSLVRSDGRRNSPYFFPAHGEDTTQPATYKAITALINEAKSQGFKEYLLVDYIWPWDGRWGYGDETVQAFREDLKKTDKGMYIGNGDGTFRLINFWDYLNIYNDYPISPKDVASFNPLMAGNAQILSSWDEYVPVSESQASISSDKIKRNFYLFNALWHYEHLKQYQKLGDYAASIGMTMFASFNTESTFNGTDTYMMGMLRNVEKVGYEYFGDPGGNTTFYHTMRYFADNMRSNGHDMSLIGEINETGHGPSKYSWDIAYAYYYDAITASKPIDYNNQYISGGSWKNISTYDSQYHFDRYAHWYSGAAAFFQTYKENGDKLQNKKDTVVVASRSVLEYQGGSINSFMQTGNMAGVLDQLHIPFDSVGKENFYDYAKDAKTLVYSPAESSPMHGEKLITWLGEGTGKSIVTHSFVPFSKSTSIIDLKPSQSSDLTWDGVGNWGTALNQPRIDQNGLMGLSLQSTEPDKKTTIGYGETNGTDINIYTLSGDDVNVLVKANDGTTPLISQITRGQNKIIYINADISDKRAENEEFYWKVAEKAMELANNVRPEATAESSMAVHIYEVPGGNSVTLWDRDTFDAQRKNAVTYVGSQRFIQFHRDTMEKMTTPIPNDSEGRFNTVKKPAETVKIHNFKPNTDYIVYDFINDVETIQASDSNGNITFATNMSTEMLYIGEAGVEFNKTVADAKETRAKLDRFDEKVPEGISLTDAKAANPDQNLLVFQGGLDSAYVTDQGHGTTDGTTVIFEGWDETLNSGAGGWYKIGRKDFNGVASNDTSKVWALPLGSSVPQKIRIVANKNMNTSFDYTLLKTLKVINSSDELQVDYLSGVLKEVGLYKQGDFSNDIGNYASSGAVMNLSTEVAFHPPWGNYDGQCVYGIIENIAIDEAGSFEAVKAANPSCNYYLTFKGGMDANSPDTDGVTLLFEGRSANGDWKIIGKKNLKDVYYNTANGKTSDTTLWTLPLGDLQATEVRVTVSKNATTANDATRLTEFAIVKNSGEMVKNFMNGTLKEIGLADAGINTPMSEIPDAAMQFNAVEGTLFMHPTYATNSSKNIYGVFSVVPETSDEALPLADAKAANPESQYFLTFDAGMYALFYGQTDGTTVSFEGSNDGNTWTAIGKKNFDGIFIYGDGSISVNSVKLALPLGSSIPKHIRMTAKKNANNTGDCTYFTTLQAENAEGVVQKDYKTGYFSELGLVQNSTYVRQDISVIAHVKNDGSRIEIQPPFDNSSTSPVYGVISPIETAEAFETTKNENQNSNYFLTLKGGMELAVSETDGVTVLFEGSSDNGSTWNIIGKKNFNDIQNGNGITWTLPLGDTIPNDVRITVSKNANPSNDMLLITDFTIITKDEAAIKDFMTNSLSKVGLLDGGVYTEQPLTDAVMEYDANGILKIHPTYGENSAKLLYGVVTGTDVTIP